MFKHTRKHNLHKFMTLLPNTGIVSIDELAKHYSVAPATMEKALEYHGIKVMHVGRRYSQRLVSLEAIDGVLMQRAVPIEYGGKVKTNAYD